MLHTKYQGSRTYGFRKEDFFNGFPHITLCKTCYPGGGAIYGPRDIEDLREGGGVGIVVQMLKTKYHKNLLGTNFVQTCRLNSIYTMACFRAFVMIVYLVINCLISQPIHMLWVLIRTIQMRRFF